MDTAGPGYLAYFPAGGLVTAALAELLAQAANRFTGVAQVAPALVAMKHRVLTWSCDRFGLPAGAGGLVTTVSREGEIRVSRGGKLHHVRTAVSAGYPVERRVGRPAVHVKREVAGSAEVAEIRDRLAGLGLLVDPQAVAGYRVCRDLLR
ncbi:hypothetical protein ACIBO5_28980 [Nonomuraea angiospora]|uniref:hypothetical protein n=1 Tax=Nonomuraea angiospora TaxID=46172 RepID=UPI003799D994